MSELVNTPRGFKLLCAASGCQRGIGYERAMKLWGTVRVRFLCGVHWRRLTKREKAVFFRVQRVEKKLGIELSKRRHRVFGALVRRSVMP